MPAARDAGAIARQVEALNSSPIAFDEGAAQKAVAAATPNGIEREIQQLQAQARGIDAGSVAAAPAGQGAADIARQIAEAQSPKPTRPRQFDNQFVAEFARERSQPGLRPTRKEANLAVLEGTVIPAALTRSIVTDLPGVITATVNRDVYDSLTARHRLICKGSRLVGRYNNEIQAGQSRLLFAFTRLILPDGSSFDLGGFNGSDEAGAAGVGGDVNNHFWRVFGASLAIGILADRLTVASATPQGQGAQRSATGEVMVSTASEYLSRFRTVQPTITIPQGTEINVEVRRDLVFPLDATRSCT